MQTKLHHWAVDDPDRRFDDLYNLIYHPDFLTVAWERVRGNKGARTAGVDWVIPVFISDDADIVAFLENAREQLHARTFTPLPVRERMIPKPGGGGELRRLGIPTAMDRLVQAFLVLVLEPIFEADFKPVSYGFRPGRRAQDAIAEIHHFGTKGYHWVLDADIEACFDNIARSTLLERMRRRIGDKRVLALVKAFLKAGIMSADGVTTDTNTGTPQGGIASPLLANIALSALDEHFSVKWDAHGSSARRTAHRRRGGATYRIVRYADDFLIMVCGSREHAEVLWEEVADVVAPLGLRLSVAKTRVRHLDDGLDFLGFHIQRRLKKGDQQALRLHLSVEEGVGLRHGQGAGGDEQKRTSHTRRPAPPAESGGAWMVQLLPVRVFHSHLPLSRRLCLAVGDLVAAETAPWDRLEDSATSLSDRRARLEASRGRDHTVRSPAGQGGQIPLAGLQHPSTVGENRNTMSRAVRRESVERRMR